MARPEKIIENWEIELYKNQKENKFKNPMELQEEDITCCGLENVDADGLCLLCGEKGNL